MRKLSILLAVAFALILPLTAVAGSAYSNARADFGVVADRIAEDARGHAIINYDKEQEAWQVNGSLNNLLADHDYIVEVGTEGDPNGTLVAQFTTDTTGHGSFDCLVEDLPDTYDVVRLIDPSDSGWSPRGDIKMVAREDGTIGLLQFRGEMRGK